MNMNSAAFQFGYEAGKWAVVFSMLILPILFGVCLTMAITKRKAGWVVFSVITGIPALFLLGCFIYGLYIGVTQGKKNIELAASSQFHTAGSGLVKGSNYDYTIEVPDPNKWRVNRQDLTFDTVVFYRDVYIGVAVERVGPGSSEEICRQITRNLSRQDLSCTFTDPETISIDGVPWLHLDARVTVQNMPITYSFYVHSGTQGSCRVVAWTGQGIFEQEKAVMDQIARSFRFGEGIKNIKESPAPAVVPTEPAGETQSPPAAAATPEEPVKQADPEAEPSSPEQKEPAKAKPETEGSFGLT